MKRRRDALQADAVQALMKEYLPQLWHREWLRAERVFR
ncbi:hypothetical protein [Polaromonas sp. CG9_12]|nr:hypothetical protein [Polaromonas sp. CG_9.11]CDS53015.1 hypothetical protein [Polaromonas sp. CG9_12]